MDIALAVEQLLYGAKYSGSTVANTRECWDAVTWTDSRRCDKPTWTELELAWEEMQTRSLEEIKIEKIKDIDVRTAELILAGFKYEFDGQVYHFGYSADDQGNFTKAALSAALAMIQGNTDYRQSWRGWVGDSPHTLVFTATEFIALAMHAGKTHQENCLASGWAITELIRNAASAEDVEAIVDGR